MSVYQVLPIALLWISLGCFLIIFNKFLFLAEDEFGFGFQYAVFLMWFHAAVGTVAMGIVRSVRPDLMPVVTEGRLEASKYLRNVLPVAFLQAMSLSLGNTAYFHLSVAFIQMVKNTTSAFVFIFSLSLGLESATLGSTFAVALVVVGLFLTSVGEMELSPVGLALQMGATICDAVRISLMKFLLSSKNAVKLDPMSALFFFCPSICAVLTLPMLHYDLPRLTWEQLWSLKFVLLANALVALALNMSSIFFMQRCGATTYAITGVAKDVVLIVAAVQVFGHWLTQLQIVGFVISLIGFQMYNRMKQDVVTK